MDNFHFNVTGVGETGFRHIAEYAFSQHKNGIQYYSIVSDCTLVFYWTKPSTTKFAIHAFPFVMNVNGAIDFAWNWLEQVEYGPEPDHDGDNKKGWHVYNETWGHVCGMWEAFVAIKPEWAMYGK